MKTLTMQKGMVCAATAILTDAYGRAATVTEHTKWTISKPIARLQVSPDGLSVDIYSLKLGTAVVSSRAGDFRTRFRLVVIRRNAKW